MDNTSVDEKNECADKTVVTPPATKPAVERPMTFVEQVGAEALSCSLEKFPAEFAKTKQFFNKDFLLWGSLTILFCLYYAANLIGRLHREVQPGGHVVARLEFDLHIVNVTWSDILLYGLFSQVVFLLLVSYVVLIKYKQRVSCEMYDYVGRMRGIIK